MTSLSALVITLNEERNLPRCLESLAFADEIVLVDSGSTDRTLEIARKHTDRVFAREWEGYGAQRNFGIGKAAGEWVLVLDADEEVTGPLAAEIRALLAAPPARDAYTVARTCFFMGRFLRHGIWYPDRTVRLFRKDRGAYNLRAVHESVEVRGTVGRLEHEIRHYSYPDLEEYLRKFNRYTTLDAEERHLAGQGTSALDIAASPALTFLKSYVAKQGFRDGLPGFAASVLAGFYVFVKKLKLLERTWRRRSS